MKLFTPMIGALLAVLLPTGCMQASATEVPSDYLAIEWLLVAVDGQPAPARATIDFATPGRISGQAPCNRYFATQSGALPDLRLSDIAATRMACPDLAAEADFLAQLAEMTRAEVTGPTSLLLTGGKGRSMEFVRPMN